MGAFLTVLDLTEFHHLSAHISLVVVEDRVPSTPITALRAVAVLTLTLGAQEFQDKVTLEVLAQMPAPFTAVAVAEALAL